MAQPNRPQIRNIEYLRSNIRLGDGKLGSAKMGEAFDDVRTHIGNLQDQLAAALARVAELEKKVG